MRRANAVLVLALLSLTQIPAFADLPSAAIEIQNQADYVRLKQAACASQVVLTDLEREPNNRIVGVLAAMLQAAASNRQMTSEGLMQFATAFDSYLQNPTEPTLAHGGDTNLLVPVNFVTAVRFGVRAAKQEGMRADLGLEILQMLGISQDYETAQQDPTIPIQQQALMKFLDSQGLDLVHNPNTNLVLTYGFMGLDAAGNPNAGVRETFVDYLVSQNIDPFPTPAVLASEYPGVAAAMAALPADYSGLQAEKAIGFATMQTGVIQKAGTLVDSLPGIIDEAVALDALQRPDYVAALANPNQAYVDAARARRLLEMEQLNAARAEMYASLSVMRIAGATDETTEAIGKYAGAAASLIAGVAGIASAFVAPSPVTIALAVAGVLEISSTVCSLIDADAAGGELEKPDIDEQITTMRLDMQYMHDQLNHRFDAVDSTLDQVLLKLGDTNLQLDIIREAVYELQSNLNRMNQRLFGAILGCYQHDFILALNSALGYKDLNGYDLAYSTFAQSFGEYENQIHDQATNTAYNLLAGEYTCQLSLDNVDTHLSLQNQSGNYGWYINDFRQFPLASGLYDYELYGSRVSSPTAWATAANAYAELARENPWWSANQRRNQPSRLDLVRARGVQTRDALRNFGNREFISALVQRHRDAQDDFVDAANAVLLEVINEGVPAYPTYRRVSDAQLSQLDIWGDPTQRVAGWPDPSAKCYKCNPCSDPLGPFGTLLPGELPVTTAFVESGALVNQHNLGLGTLSAHVVPTWKTWIDATGGDTRRCVVRWWQIWNSDAYAVPVAYEQLYHHDDANNTPVMVYTMYMSRGTHEILVGTVSSVGCLLSDGWWLTVNLDKVFIEEWNATHHPLYDEALNHLLTDPTHWKYIGNRARLDAVAQGLEVLFDGLQTTYYNQMLQQLDTVGSPIANAAKTLSSLQALMEAYISLAYPQSMDSNQLLHGILRGSQFQYTDTGGIVKYGTMTIGAEAVKRIYLDALTTPPPQKPDIRDVLGARLDALQAQLGTVAPPEATVSDEIHPFLKYALANLTYVGAGPAQLANDDTYIDIVDGLDLTVPFSEGVLANDAPCPNPLEGTPYEVTARFDDTSPAGGQRTTSAGGTVTFDADGRGGFTYHAPAGFSGIDSFSYQACGEFDNPVDPQSLFSNIATVHISVVSGPAILAQPQDVTVVAGQPAVMQVGVGSDSWQLTWRKNGIPLSDNDHMLGTQTDTLVIPSTGLEDTGNYDVVFYLPGWPSYVSDSAALTVLPGSIPDVKRGPDTIVADMLGCVVTRVWPDFFYVQTPCRSVGIQVRRTAHGVSTGDVVALRGNIYTDEDEERFVSASAIVPIGTGPAEPLFLTNRAIGGGDGFSDLGNGQRGIVDGVGLNNVGLLIRACGEVTYTDPGGLFFDVWDGSTYQSGIAPIDPQGAEGVRVSAAGMALPSPGDFVVVTGISSLRQDDSTILPEILVSDEADIASVTWAPQPSSLAEIKTSSDGTVVASLPSVVTAVFGDDFYIEQLNRAAGIRVRKAGHGLQLGDKVATIGTLGTNSDGERYVEAAVIQESGTGNVDPLGTTNSSLGGGDFLDSITGFGQNGVLGGFGLNNIGLLIKTWGKVASVGADQFTIDDGSDVDIKCVVPAGVTLPSLDDYVSVTGISSCEKPGDDLLPLIRARSQDDVVLQ